MTLNVQFQSCALLQCSTALKFAYDIGCWYKNQHYHQNIFMERPRDRLLSCDINGLMLMLLLLTLTAKGLKFDHIQPYFLHCRIFNTVDQIQLHISRVGNNCCTNCPRQLRISPTFYSIFCRINRKAAYQCDQILELKVA